MCRKSTKNSTAVVNTIEKKGANTVKDINDRGCTLSAIVEDTMTSRSEKKDGEKKEKERKAWHSLTQL